MASPIEISNLALSRIGIDQLIEDFNDPNNRAKQCLQHYDHCREEVLQDFPWNFAQKVVALAVVADVTVPGWGYVYRYPSGALKIHALTSEAGGRWMTTSLSYSGGDTFAELPNTLRYPYRVMADPVTEGAKVIVSDLELAYCWYTDNAADTNQMTPLFRSALAWKMAAEIALGLRAETRLHTNAIQQYAWVVSQAQAHSHGETAPDMGPTPEAIAVRW